MPDFVQWSQDRTSDECLQDHCTACSGQVPDPDGGTTHCRCYCHEENR